MGAGLSIENVKFLPRGELRRCAVATLFDAAQTAREEGIRVCVVSCALRERDLSEHMRRHPREVGRGVREPRQRRHFTASPKIVRYWLQKIRAHNEPFR